MRNKPLELLALAAVGCMCLLGCGREMKPWTVYYSGQTGNTVLYFRFTDSEGKLNSDSYQTKEEVKAAMEAAILMHQNNRAERVWREAP